MNWERKGNFKNQIAKLNLHQGDWVTQLLSDYFQLYNKYMEPTGMKLNKNLLILNEFPLLRLTTQFYKILMCWSD